jgi:hypothetical protein
MKRFLIALFVFFAFSGIAPAEDLYCGKSASKYIGQLKEKLSSASYSVVLLERRDYESVTHAQYDGIIFIPAAFKYHYIRRLNDDHLLRLNSVDGAQAALAKPEDSSKYQSLIAENKLYPQVVLDKDSKELFVIFSAVRERVVWSQDKQGQILLELRDPFKRHGTDLFSNKLVFQGTK